MNQNFSFEIESKSFKSEEGKVISYNQIVLVFHNEKLNKDFRFPIKCIYKESQKLLMNLISNLDE